MKPITNRFATRMLVVAVDIRRTQLLILEILWHTCLSCGTQQWPFQQVFFLFACISTFWRHFELRYVYVHVHTDATLLDVICFLRLQTLLHVVRSCCVNFETGEPFAPTTPNIPFVPWSPKSGTTMLDPFALLVQHCWGHTRPYTHDLQGRMGRIVLTIHCRSQTCWELLHPFAYHCQHARNNSQHCWANNVGSCSSLCT